MAETIKIEIYRQKNAEEFTAALADPDSRLETGSGAAAAAAVASAFLCRAAGLTARTAGENERVALHKFHVLYAFCLGVVLTKKFGKRRVIFAPTVDADDFCFWVLLGDGNGESAASASDVEAFSAHGNDDFGSGLFDDAPRKLTGAIIRKSIVPGEHKGAYYR